MQVGSSAGISGEFGRAGVDVLCLQGTRIRAPTANTALEGATDFTKKGIASSVGGMAGGSTLTRVSGCRSVFAQKLRCAVVQVFSRPKTLAGRAGGVRIKGEAHDVIVLSLYFPLRGHTGEGRGV